MKIKRVNFKAISAIRPEHKYVQAWYDEDKDHIVIDKDAPDITRLSYGELLRHEKGHRIIRKAGCTKYFTDEQDELFADLMMYAMLKGKNLFGSDKYLFDKVCGKYRWNNKADRAKIITRMLKVCKVRATEVLVNSLVGSS